jgi:hypothetical protein
MQIIQDTQKASVHQPRNPANEQTLFFSSEILYPLTV